MLNKASIKELILKQKLIEGFINLDKQLTPNGIDLTVAAIEKFINPGALDFSNKERIIPETRPITAQKEKEEDRYGWWNLSPGAYKVKSNEVVNLPNNLTALAFSRTSLLRMGCFAVNGVWDAGFSGRGEFILSVQNSEGVKIKENSRLIQLLFLEVELTESYKGIYQGKM